MKKKKISREEMEDILHDEEVEAMWKSIRNSETIRKAEADEKFWREHLDPFYDEMLPHVPAKAVSDVVRKDMEEYEANEPILKELDYMSNLLQLWVIRLGLIWSGFLLSIVLWVVWTAMNPEDSCLSC